MSFQKRFLVKWINRLAPFKHNKFKVKLFNKIKGCHCDPTSIIVGPIDITGTTVHIGKNCFIGRNFTCEGNGNISIGDNCDIAPSVVFLTGSHDIGDTTRRAGVGITNNIVVGNGVWIGSRSVILCSKNKGVDRKIGSGSVIGCCSNVISDIEENSFYAGNPAKLKRSLDD